MQCKQCGSRLEPEMELCPQCGTKVDKNEEIEASSGKGVKILKIAVSLVLVLALLCGMVLVVFKNDLVPGHWFSSLPGSIPKDGNRDNVTCEGTYTASRLGLKWKNDTVVAKIGDEVLTNGQLLVFYGVVKNNFVQTYTNLSSINLDMKLPLDRQTCGLDETLTWQQYFLQEALNQWRLYVLLCQNAEAAGCELPEEKQQSLHDKYNQFYKDYVETGMYESVDAVMEANYGPGCTYADYLNYATMAAIASMYYNQMIEEQTENITEEDIEDFYEDQKDYLKLYNIIKGDGNIVVDVRHILITVQRVVNKEEHIDESDWKKTEEAAQKILDDWLAGEATEESFAALAKEHSADPGSVEKGGLYTEVNKGQMVAEFDTWCFDASRKAGDYGLIRTNHGYHIMYFVGSEEYWHNISKKNAPTWRVNKLLETQRDALDIEIKYQKIKLWEAGYYAE
ncbi:MAG: peptidylprolyl isomerase [Oscillospiraceae bacterium]|nr:peptidylprolyl isomerase [Oscillospiraceae bacterium]